MQEAVSHLATSEGKRAEIAINWRKVAREFHDGSELEADVEIKGWSRFYFWTWGRIIKSNPLGGTPPPPSASCDLINYYIRQLKGPNYNVIPVYSDCWLIGMFRGPL